MIFILKSDVFKNNKIPNIILSSASLPAADRIQVVIDSFKNKFKNRQIDLLEIKSSMNQNSISIYDDCGNIMMPHLLWLESKYKENLQNYFHLNDREELQKFLSVSECIKFINDEDIFLLIFCNIKK